MRDDNVRRRSGTKRSNRLDSLECEKEPLLATAVSANMCLFEIDNWADLVICYAKLVQVVRVKEMRWIDTPAGVA